MNKAQLRDVIATQHNALINAQNFIDNIRFGHANKAGMVKVDQNEAETVGEEIDNAVSDTETVAMDSPKLWDAVYAS